MNVIWNTSDHYPAAYVVTIHLQKQLTFEQRHLVMENIIQEWLKSRQTNGQFRFVESVTVNSTASEMN